MIKKILSTLGFGLAAYVVYETYQQQGIESSEGEGGYLDTALGVVQGGFSKVSFGDGLNMQISLAGLNHIKGWERFEPYVYDDAARKPTIGYGHLIKPYESFDTITKQDALILLAKDISDTEVAINKYVKVPLTQNQYDALCSLVFNIGKAGFRTSKMLKKLNVGDYKAVEYHMPTWRNITVDGVKVVSKGLVRRRASDLAVWVNGTYRTA